MDKAAYNTAKMLESFFKDFYYELLKCKEIALRTTRFDEDLDNAGYAVPLKESPETGDPANQNQHPTEKHKMLASGVPVHAVKALTEIQNRLNKVLDDQSTKIALLPQSDAPTFKDAQYAMVSLADEVFLNLVWKGRFAWQNSLLEGQVFHSQSSGETIFQRIDTLLSKYDPSKIGIVRIYFFILSLGFKGKYSDFQEFEIIKNYENRIYAFIYGVNSSIAKYSKLNIIPECYDHTVASQDKSKLPDVKFWTRIIFTIVIIYVFASYVLWYDVANDIYKSLENVFQHFTFFLSK